MPPPPPPRGGGGGAVKYPGLRPWFYSHLLNRIMLRIVEAIIGLELCEQSCTERAAQCQETIHASEAARSAAERACYQGTNYTPP